MFVFHCICMFIDMFIVQRGGGVRDFWFSAFFIWGGGGG